MFEHRKQPLLSREAFARRLIRHAGIAVGVVLASLTLGVIGYHQLEDMGWVDAILNAAMILAGMGPINQLHTTAGKLFAAGYALFSGIVFLVVVGVLLAPVMHRFLHRFHWDFDSER
jgi:hypothetical protein